MTSPGVNPLYGAINSQVGQVSARLRPLGYKIHADVEGKVSEEVREGIRAGTIGTEEDVGVVSAALLAAAAEVRAKSEGEEIQSSDVDTGWEQHIEIVPGCIPKEDCYFRSILSRQESLGSSLPLFNHLLQ